MLNPYVRTFAASPYIIYLKIKWIIIIEDYSSGWNVLTHFSFSVTAAVKIKSIRVPEIELLDENKSVILDCDFDAGNDTDLVVKWFHEDNLIYQWIMNHDPQEVGAFKGKLDLSYKATDDKTSMYRALKIKRLSLDLAGEYKCVVFNYMSEDSMSKKMIIISKYFILIQLFFVS